MSLIIKGKIPPIQETECYKKALSIKNPYAWLIANGIKDIENRSRRTHYRGKILIHVSQKFAGHPIDLLTEVQHTEVVKFLNEKPNNYHPFSSIIGEVEIVDCVNDSGSIWALPDQWHWVLKNPVLYKNPIPNVKGKLGLWNYKPELK